MTKVEEATKAAYEDWISGVEDLELPWDKLPHDHKLRLMSSIRAAIEALMEPTPAMVAATEDICVGFGGELSDINIYCDDYKAVEIFRTMITAALGETDE